MINYKKSKNNPMNFLKTIALLLVAITTQAQQPEPAKTLIVIFDGLRPDYITPEQMPNLYAFKKQGVLATQHHSVFPTVTRLNTSAYSTGSYPAKSGILENNVYFPEVDMSKSLNTGDARALKRIDSATHGQLLTTVSFGEVLQAAGKRLMVFSSGSTGQAFLQNHTLSGGAIVNPDMILPESYKETVYDAVGQIPAGKEHSAKHIWATDALIKLGLQPGGADVCAIWMSDPDHTTHADGIGTPSAVAAIKLVDEQFGRILTHLKQANLDGDYNIMITADHGFITYAGNTTITKHLIENGFKKSKASDDVVVAGRAIHVKNHDPETIKKIVASLQESEYIGAIFTKGAKPGDLEGWVDGTIAFEAIHWDHPTRTADILVDMNWDDRENEYGYRGTSSYVGPAGHGGLTPYEVHIAWIASGPDFKKRAETKLPTSIVDIVPTVLHLQHVPVPDQMDGRVAYEMLNRKTPSTAPKKAKKDKVVTHVKAPWGTYKLTLQRTILGKYTYIDFAKAERITTGQ